MGKLTINYNIGDIVITKYGKLQITNKTIGTNGEIKYSYVNLSNIEIDEERLRIDSNFIINTHPHLVKYFKNIEDAYTHSYGSRDKVWFKCPDCGFEKEIIISNFIKYGFNCPKCGDGIKQPNKIGFNVLEQLNSDFETEKRFDWCKYEFENKLKQGVYDFYFKLNNKEYILEMDGWFHKNDNKMNGQTAQESKVIDSEKDRLALEHGIEVIRIDCDYGNHDSFEYIKNNILNNKKLNGLFNLNVIDWYKVSEFTTNNRVKEVCELWNSGIHSTKEIANIKKLGRNTITRWLNKGKKLGWCDYDAEEEMIKSNRLNSVKNIESNSTPIICITTGHIFKSVKECERQSLEVFGVQLFSGNISMVCSGEKESYKGYVFKHYK